MQMVLEVDFHIHQDFVQKIFDSCKGITAQGGLSVINGLMCGEWGVHCNPERLFEYLGTGPPKGHAPFNIKYNISDKIEKPDGIRPLNSKGINKIASCEEGVEVSIIVVRLCIHT